MTPTIQKLADFLLAHPEYNDIPPIELVTQLTALTQEGDIPVNEIDRFLSTNFLNYPVEMMYQNEATPEQLKAVLFEIKNFRNAIWGNVALSTFNGLLVMMVYFPFLTDAHKAGLTALKMNRRSVLDVEGIGAVSEMDIIFARQQLVTGEEIV